MNSSVVIWNLGMSLVWSMTSPTHILSNHDVAIMQFIYSNVRLLFRMAKYSQPAKIVLIVFSSVLVNLTVVLKVI